MGELLYAGRNKPVTPLLSAFVRSFSSLQKRVLSIHFLPYEPQLAAILRHPGKIEQKNCTVTSGGNLEFRHPLATGSQIS